MPALLADLLARRLTHDLADPDFPLGSISELARRYGASYVPMRAAVQSVARKGLLEVLVGRAPRRPGRPAPEAEPTLRLRADITSGTLRCGEPLPKVSVLLSSLGCGREQLGRACRTLAGEGLLHRDQRRWIVGSRPVRPHAASGDMPIVLMAGDSERFWSYQLSSPMAAFYRRFVQELDAAGIALRFVPATRTSITRARDVSGLQGAVVITELPDAELATLHRILVGERLPVSQRLPVVFFDNANRHPRLAQTVPGVLRCAFDEPQAMDLLLMELARRGHQRVGVPLPNQVWVARRMALLRAAALRVGVELLETPLKERFWAHDYSSQGFRLPEDLLRGMAGRSHASPTTARTLARTRCTSLFSLLDHGATALIGLNDHYAREFQMALEFAGITVPGRCSIVGIDNHAQTAVFGLSTIDVGFDRLGYLAAHHLIGDVPIAIGRHGSVTSLSRLIDRGSLA